MVLGGACLYIGEAVEDEWLWRGGEYDKLVNLRAGFDLSYFESQLGTPTVSRGYRGYEESAFKGRGYWVQTISRSGAVVLYAITACDQSFHPTFSPIGTGLMVELNRSRLADVAPANSGFSYDYFVGATAPPLFYEGLYAGFSGYYKTFLWGWNSVCDKAGDSHLAPPTNAAPRGSTAMLDTRHDRFREETQINTYAETAPATFPEQPEGRERLSALPPVNLHQTHGFSVGPSRLSLQLAR